MTSTIHLGFEVGDGAAVEIPIGHMVVTGQTQQAGKTTALEALIQRSGLRAVTFVTKRGERAFAGGRRLQPFFRERADWVFVSSLIDATLGEKNKLLRAWLMKVCRDTRTLAEVQANVAAAKADARGFAESIYTEIEGYLELVVPQLAQLPPARGVKIGEGLNVMDLSPYSPELQALVIKSVLEHVYENEHGVVTVIPEAWEFLPEGRGSPVKREAETLIRKGAGLGNFVWLDSQDLAGVWKTAVRAAAVCLIGVQREANEIKRTLANIPAGTAKPTAAAIAVLERGQFYACFGRHVHKTYVQPTWMDAEAAHAVACGDDEPTPRPADASRVPVSHVPYPTAPVPHSCEEEFMSKEAEAKLDQILEFLRRGSAAQAAVDAVAPLAPAATAPVDEEALYQRFKARLAQEAPALLKLLTVKPELRVTESVQTIEIDGDTLRGRLALLIADGFFDQPTAGNAAFNELKRRGFATAKPNVYREADKLAELGFLTKEATGYQAVPGMKKNVVRG